MALLRDEKSLEPGGCWWRDPTVTVRRPCYSSVVTNVVKAIDGPVVLVGHSYGGAVIGQASAGLENVTGLVFLAALGLEVGESCATVQQPFPPPLLAQTVARPPSTPPAPLAVRTYTLRRTGSGRRSVPTFRSTCPMSCSRLSARWRSRRSTRTPPRRVGRPNRPGSWSPSTTTPSRRTLNVHGAADGRHD